MATKFLTHPQFRDILMEVVKITYRDEKRVKAKVNWWNRGFDGTSPWPLFAEPETREFTLAKWREFIPYKSQSDTASSTEG